MVESIIDFGSIALCWRQVVRTRCDFPQIKIDEAEERLVQELGMLAE